MAIAGGRKTIGVIGAGMIGVTTASFLLRSGHDVVLLDPGDPERTPDRQCWLLQRLVSRADVDAGRHPQRPEMAG